jgi:hypothetical protein
LGKPQQVFLSAFLVVLPVDFSNIVVSKLLLEGIKLSQQDFLHLNL